MEKTDISGVPTASELEQKADKLEAISGLLHGSAYAPVIKAARFFKRLAKQPQPGDGIAPGTFDELISELNKFANTVAKPASTRMVDAAQTLALFQPPKV